MSMLVCTDNTEFYVAIEAVMGKRHVSTHRVNQERDVYASLRGGQFQLALVDESFSKQNGQGFIASLHRRAGKAGLPVVAVVSEITESKIENLFRHGVADFIHIHDNLDVAGHRLLNLLQQYQSKRDLEVQHQYMSKYDPLTGLYNRQFFNEKLQRSMRNTLDSGKVSALFHIDVDNFKRINSSFNYQYGDGLLQQVANRLLNSLRSSDFIMRDAQNVLSEQGLARLGGDEFILFVEDIGHGDNATTIANRCIEAVSQPLELRGQNVVLTASLGVATYPHDGQNVDTLMKNAEKAMYIAKERGGGCFTCYRQEMNLADESSFLLENDLRDALNKGQLTLHYQPQIDAVSGKISSVEALCRWEHPLLGMVAPDRFIPIAEASGLIVPIGDWVLETACKQAKVWLDEGKHIHRIAVNVSAYQFNKHDFLNNVKRVLRETKLPPKHLEIELTESIIMSDAEENIGKLLKLKRLGIELAVDDFGTGYSSLAYLKQLPISTLKIDRSFISNIGDDTTEGAIVSAILTLAQKLKLNVVAEGVETSEQFDFLRKNQCGLIQGFLFSPARPKEEIQQFIGKQFKNDWDTCINKNGNKLTSRVA
ncbi:bifunctional diguanylate cyclase/phosphodiesterase [Aestuariibacter sp. AA17]|uniref:Bifunctional diguanylate cyclase/phosphodiesterase n=1 Tax=Fluctibacter corallii TaxID=2984329 RepID=A0ABT3A5F1_9ALTE|nr:bifunctional diguanylate cyclase/phosphodiesterase [Aestuariibacter sp. AA17]MCV2883868.1 bifunctional diguanylate cyclase/phosphodiesterase [Aestuariibacter sp. AA17]